MRHGPVSFRDAFVRPLFEARTALVGAPLRPRDLRRLVGEASTIFDAPTTAALERRIGRMVPLALSGRPGPDDVVVMACAHNLLAMAHPERQRVLARATRWTDVQAMTVRWFEGAVEGASVAPERLHFLLDAVLAARWTSRVRRTRRLRRPRARLALAPAAVQGGDGSGAAGAPTVATAALPPLALALRTAMVVRSPWTALLCPEALGDAPFPLEAIGRLASRPMWRAVCHAWADGDRWIDRGGAVMERLGRSLRASEGVTVDLRRGAGWILAALVHVHLLRVWCDDARLATTFDLAAEPVQHFLALPLVAPRLSRVLGDPLAGASPRLRHLWDVHLERLGQVVLRHVRREMVDAVVDPVVERT